MTKRKKERKKSHVSEKTPKNSPISLRNLKRNYCNTYAENVVREIYCNHSSSPYLPSYVQLCIQSSSDWTWRSIEDGRVAATGDQWADSLGSKKNPSPLLQFPILIFFLYLSLLSFFSSITSRDSSWNFWMQKGGCVHGDQGNLVTIRRQRSKKMGGGSRSSRLIN